MKNKKQSGLIKLVILIIAIILILSYFGINIQKIVESDTGRANFAYLWGIGQRIGDWFIGLYNQYLDSYIDKIWSYVPKNLIK